MGARMGNCVQMTGEAIKDDQPFEEDHPTVQYPDSWLIGARTYFMDRYTPACEHIVLPGRALPGGRLRIRRGDLSELTFHVPRRQRLLSRLTGRGAEVQRLPGLAVDARRNSPQNWAHFLDDHVPLYFHICDRKNLDPAQVTMLLPANTPRYILSAAEIFGIPVVTSDARFTGPCLIAEFRFERDRPASGEDPAWRRMPAGVQILGARTDWARLPAPQARLREIFAQRTGLPPRVFLARRKSREVSNANEIAPVLARYGFTTIYPEDLTAADQFRLFHEVEVMLAVHGAGLAPLIYRGPDSALSTLVEIMPCGHMTPNFRDMAAQVGVAWTGVRGRPKPEYLREIARMRSYGFVKYSLDPFEVDPVSLEEAFARAGVTPRSAPPTT